MPPFISTKYPSGVFVLTSPQSECKSFQVDLTIFIIRQRWFYRQPRTIIFACCKFKVSQSERTIQFRDFKNINLELLYNSLELVPWNDIYSFGSVVQQVDFLRDKLVCLYNKFVPLKTKVIKYNTRPWYNDSVKNAIHERNIAYRDWKKYRIHAFYDKFKENRLRTNKTIRASKM